MNIRATTAALLLLSTGLLPAPATAQMSGTCFDVTVGPWRPGPVVGDLDGRAAPEAGQPSSSSELPRRLQFVDSLVGRANYLLRVPEGTLDTSHPWKVWARTADSLELTFSTGHGGSVTRLGRDGTNWVGRSRTFTDHLPYRSLERPITLRPTDCAAPSPEPESVDPPLPRSVEFETRIAVALGERLPGAWTDVFEASEWASGINTTGPLAGADSLRVRTARNGRVRQVDLVYPADADLTEFRTLLDELSAPQGPRWANRTTVVMIRRFDFGRVVTLLDPRLDGR